MTASTRPETVAAGGLRIQRRAPTDRVVALAGNPNVGKSTIFNALTQKNQHTGNWPGKTVFNAQGRCQHNGHASIFVDIPGCYSLMAHSAEEEAARDFICFGGPDAVVVVCDATCLERNLNLVLQIMEAVPRVAVAVNLMDEAQKKNLTPDLAKLSQQLGVPAIGTTARSKKGLDRLLDALDTMDEETPARAPLVRYPAYIEQKIERLLPALTKALDRGSGGMEDTDRAAGKGARLSPRWLAARLLDANASLLAAVKTHLGFDVAHSAAVREALAQIHAELDAQGISHERLQDDLAAASVVAAERIAQSVREKPGQSRHGVDRRLDRLFTSRATGFPIMLAMLLGVFWLTITGANVPSELLSRALFGLESLLSEWMLALGAPTALIELLVHGGYRVMAWVVAVMLPPMAIFFPLFTLLEDFGYLPRVAFNLDRCFKGCAACGKQALCMCMGFGCNAVGVTGCRIIDSKRERLIAIITNSFVPCNGRFAPPHKGKENAF